MQDSQQLSNSWTGVLTVAKSSKHSTKHPVHCNIFRLYCEHFIFPGLYSPHSFRPGSNASSSQEMSSPRKAFILFIVLLAASDMVVTCAFTGTLRESTVIIPQGANTKCGQCTQRMSKSLSKLSWLPDWRVTISSDVLYLYLIGEILGCGNNYSIEIIGSLRFPQRSPDTTNSQLPSGF